jgi:hypothetical protein
LDGAKKLAQEIHAILQAERVVFCKSAGCRVHLLKRVPQKGTHAPVSIGGGVKLAVGF